LLENIYNKVYTKNASQIFNEFIDAKYKNHLERSGSRSPARSVDNSLSARENSKSPRRSPISKGPIRKTTPKKPVPELTIPQEIKLQQQTSLTHREDSSVNRTSSELNKGFVQEKSDRTATAEKSQTIQEDHMLSTIEKDSFYDSIRKTTNLQDVSNLTDALDKSEMHLQPKEDLRDQDSFRWEASGVVEKKPFEFRLPTNESRSYYDTEFEFESTKKDLTVGDISEEREREPPKPSPKDLKLNFEKLHSVDIFHEENIDTMPSRDVEDEFELMTRMKIMKLNSICESDQTSKAQESSDGSRSKEARAAPESFRDFKEYKPTSEVNSTLAAQEGTQETPQKTKPEEPRQPESPQKEETAIERIPPTTVKKPKPGPSSLRGSRKTSETLLKSEKKSYSLQKIPSLKKTLAQATEIKGKRKTPSFGQSGSKSERSRTPSREQSYGASSLTERSKEETVKNAPEQSDEELLSLMQDEERKQIITEDLSAQSHPSFKSEESGSEKRVDFTKRRQESFGSYPLEEPSNSHNNSENSEIIVKENFITDKSSSQSSRKETFTKEDAYEIGQLSGKIIAKMESMEKERKDLSAHFKPTPAFQASQNLFKKRPLVSDEPFNKKITFTWNHLKYLRDVEDKAARRIQKAYRKFAAQRPKVPKFPQEEAQSSDEKNEFKVK